MPSQGVFRMRMPSSLVATVVMASALLLLVPSAWACCCGKNTGGAASETMRHGAGFCGMIHGAPGSNASEVCQSKGCTFHPELRPPCAAACHQLGHFVKEKYFSAFVEEKSQVEMANPATEIESMLQSLKAQLKDGENEAAQHAAERESECHSNLKELLASLNEAKAKMMALPDLHKQAEEKMQVTMSSSRLQDLEKEEQKIIATKERLDKIYGIATSAHAVTASSDNGMTARITEIKHLASDMIQQLTLHFQGQAANDEVKSLLRAHVDGNKKVDDDDAMEKEGMADESDAPDEEWKSPDAKKLVEFLRSMVENAAKEQDALDNSIDESEEAWHNLTVRRLDSTTRRQQRITEIRKMMAKLGAIKNSTEKKVEHEEAISSGLQAEEARAGLLVARRQRMYDLARETCNLYKGNHDFHHQARTHSLDLTAKVIDAIQDSVMHAKNAEEKTELALEGTYVSDLEKKDAK
jgi:hypothetical protein